MHSKYIISFIICLLMFTAVFAEKHTDNEATEGKEFQPVDMIMSHITDSNEWHLWTTTDEEGHEHHVSIPLPIIIWDGEFKAFLSSKIAHGHTHRGYTMVDGVLTATDGTDKATIVDLFSGLEGKYVDLSITKNTTAMFISILLLLLIFITMAKSYKKNKLKPRGIAAFLEPIVVFIREEVAIPNIGENKTDKYLPYLLTVFFFIWFNNLLGLLPTFPGGANVTGNIAVTLVLALCTMVIVNLNGNKHYWKEIFTPDVPILMYPIMIPVEIIGIFTKPFALMIRLFANITAGHIIVLSLIGMIFIFKSAFVSVGAIPMTLFVLLLELLVAALQAYIFTVLSALFIGLAVKEHH
ncbi:ATP synthase F0 subcomplex A subunit [Balneicella halophila]|uniref:ATP synthase subunit a n=1 Tax=Balneicella halophila TaxID=1537566 RepID=A0A7L4UP54_BALHA|nr:F0F1 ATP synthase subunit A [Balneicella halophila]PVX50913.1 ATP synthase F0 subcomplex A subunit [Balneicella halophila]